MRPCQNCGSPLELNAATCLQCDTAQVESVGLKAPDLEPHEPVTAGSELFNDSRWIAYPAIACLLVVGVSAWLAAGHVVYGIGAMFLVFVIVAMFFDVSIFIG